MEHNTAYISTTEDDTHNSKYFNKTQSSMSQVPKPKDGKVPQTGGKKKKNIVKSLDKQFSMEFIDLYFSN